LCHVAYVRPRFEEAHWNAYKAVNELFAEAILSEVNGRDAFVFVQDYHLALLPRLIKERAPNVVTSQFWHIPWPNPETFRIFPWRKEVLDGLLGNDLLGFQIRNHCNNFLATVDRTLEARLDYERNDIVRGGRRTAVRPFPISIDFHQVCQDSQLEEVDEEIDRLRGQYWLDRQCIGLGLDRIDYTKGIPDRLRAFDRFLTLYPEYHGKVVLVQVGAPSRTDIVSYQTLNDELDRLVEDINGRHGDRRWRPVVYLPEDLPQVTLLALRRLAHFALVSSLQDGMNLVAKEFVASRFDDDGVLILSRFTGAARELSDALLVNPYATDEFALAIKTAVDMPLAERQRRMRRMRQVVRENNVYDWAGAIVSELARLAMR
jgi:trehalose 6-phosphate synthase